ncbi:DUF6193 family natural product biosynthesis protein [Streptomyces sp. NPDC048650]|uniref:DUF6193 family natural product biosynthesis protein n=1 Tax=Streptomyces sp. NPDC048650 TaxID=3365583 RepID=UPI003721DB71
MILATAGEPRRPEESPLFAPFAELVRVAQAEPLLRQLYPWTGMWELHFSRCTEIRHTWDIPYIGTLGDGRYHVEGPSRTSPRIAETDNAQAAVTMVIDRLPTHCGRPSSVVQRNWPPTRAHETAGRGGRLTSWKQLHERL